MKKGFLIFFILFSSLTRGFCESNQNEPFPSGGSFSKKYGNISADATAAAVATSMVGWGVGLAAVITTLALLIPPDEQNNSHSHCDSP